MFNMTDVEKVTKENAELGFTTFTKATKSAQEIAGEAADYSKKSFEEGRTAFEKAVAAKTFEKAAEVQTAYAKSAYEGFVAQANKMNELYTAAIKDFYAPVQSAFEKTAKAAK